METGLKPLQEAVGGYIEAVYPFNEPVAIIVNEEGKLNGLPLNRALRHKNGEIYDIIAGNMLIVGVSPEDFTSLEPRFLKKFQQMFQQPEAFIRMGRSVIAVPIPEKQIKGEDQPKKPPKKHQIGR